MYNLKDTAIPWIGSIPEEWNVEKVKQHFFLKKTKAQQENPVILSLARSGIKVRDISSNEGQIAESYFNYNPVEPGDLLLNPMDLVSGANCNVSKVTGVISPAYSNLRSKGYAEPEYYNYFFKWQYIIMALFAHGKGVSSDNRWTLNNNELLNYYIPVPTQEEQKQIVRFLDWKISDINKLISSKQREISLIRERKLAEIDRSVTRGVHSTTLKESGLNWLPLIPEGWETIPAKALFEHVTELRHESDEMLAATQKYGMIPQKEYMEREGRRIVLATDNLDKWLHVEPDEFIISLRSFQGGLELCTMEGCVTWHYVVLRPKENVYVPYFKWLFKSPSYIGALQRTSDFIRDGQDLRFSNFVKVRLLLIPIQEQRAIADYLERVVPRFDEVEKKLLHEIDLLKELRDKIIEEVVTGRIDVRNIVIPEFEYKEECPNDESDIIPDGDEIEEQEN